MSNAYDFKHDFKAALEAFDVLCKAQHALELPRLYKDAEKTIRFALQLAEKVCGEPSIAAIDAAKAEFKTLEKACNDVGRPLSWEGGAMVVFQAMRDQMLKEIEQGDGQ